MLFVLFASAVVLFAVLIVARVYSIPAKPDIDYSMGETERHQKFLLSRWREKMNVLTPKSWTQK